jgi:voltage-gated potassium channel
MRKKLTGLDIFSLTLSIYVIVIIVIDTLIELNSEVSKLVHIIDHAICLFFFVEFIIRFSRAEDKLKYMKWGWLDLLACIPMSDWFRGGKVVRILKIIRLLRALKSLAYIAQILYKNRMRNVKTSLGLLFISLVIFSSIAILQFESYHEGANIKTAEDALWWSVVTVSTVGYGDRFPVTTEGRVVGMFVILCGIGIFTTLAGYIGARFLEDRREHSSETS